ncbi:hypothetical protein BRADI_2g43178v3, partial [Brachypodium distachyon]
APLAQQAGHLDNGLQFYHQKGYGGDAARPRLIILREGESRFFGGDGDDGVQAPGQKKMTRLPQEEIDSILSLTKPLSTYTPDADQAESDSDDNVNELLRDIAQARDSLWEKIYKFQDWVRSEYAANGFIEVDDDFLARNAE